MTRRRFGSGSPWEDRAGYSRAVVDGDWCFVAGTTGADPVSGRFSGDAGVQTTHALRRIAAVLDEAGFSVEDIVRARYIVADRADIDGVMAVLAQTFAAIRPAATMIVAGLVDPAMKVEIEVTARRQRRNGHPA